MKIFSIYWICLNTDTNKIRNNGSINSKLLIKDDIRGSSGKNVSMGVINWKLLSMSTRIGEKYCIFSWMNYSAEWMYIFEKMAAV